MTDLSDLVGLGMVAVALQIYPFPDAFFPEDVMTAPRPLNEP